MTRRSNTVVFFFSFVSSLVPSFVSFLVSSFAPSFVPSLVPFLLSLFISFQSFALGYEFFSGWNQYQRIDGCCKSTSEYSPSTPLGFGLGLPLPKKDISLIAFTDRYWSEIQLEKQFFLSSEPPHKETSLSTDQTQILRVPDHLFLLGLSGGYFIHSSRTLRFDLPVLVNGLLIQIRLQYLHFVTESIALGISGKSGLALSIDDKGLSSGWFLTFLWSSP